MGDKADHIVIIDGVAYLHAATIIDSIQRQVAEKKLDMTKTPVVLRVGKVDFPINCVQIEDGVLCFEPRDEPYGDMHADKRLGIIYR